MDAPVVWPDDPVALVGGGRAEPLTPRPHQQAAVEAVVEGLVERGQLLTACGTGKTLTALWVTEALGAERTLVLVPSLTLLSQTVTEWVANVSETFAYLPVCSDETVARGTDAATMFASDLQFPVTTDVDEIGSFMTGEGRRVVFSTYQSSPQIAAAQANPKVPAFDVVVADEAHRCAGRVSEGYGTVLDADKIRASKRLFMTATPRTFTSRVVKRADDEGIEVASMDDETVFGPVLHRLSFSDAIDQELLTDYRVVVVGVNDARVHEQIEQRHLVKTDTGMATDARTLASHIALAKAISDYSLSRVITFHSRIKTAAKFANQLPDVVSWMPPNQRPPGQIVANYVSGEMSVGERNTRLDQLRNIEAGQHGVLANARCLSEGIDVPALDGVAFIDPRRSQVDIVQAVGRAIRLSKDKTVGTIIIPVYLTEPDDPEETLNGSEFEPVWEIVNALRSHDDDLAETLDSIRTQLGRTGTTSRLPDRIVFDLPTGIDTDFADAINTKLVERCTSTYHYGLGVLQRYVDREGHARVPAGHVEKFDGEETRLGSWVNTRRGEFVRGVLSVGRVADLESISGWEWDAIAGSYQRNLAALRQYVDRAGHASVPRRHVETFDGEQMNLGWWVSNRRAEFREGKLSAGQVADLEAVRGWVWDPYEADFQRNLAALLQYVSRVGDARVLRGHVETVDGEDINLGGWVSSRRAEFRNGKLSAGQVADLESIPGWEWDPIEADFQRNLAALRQFVDREGPARIPARYVETFDGEDINLGPWVSNRRAEFQEGKLSAVWVADLEAVPGWVWDKLDEADFQRNLAALRQYVDSEGHARAPGGYVETVDGEDIKLGGWVSSRRAEFRNGKLSADRVADLEAVPGWEWDPIEADYQRNLAVLHQYVSREGHARVPTLYVETFDGEDIKLGGWVSSRRAEFRKGKLSAGRVADLESISGWVWDKLEATFQRSLAALHQYVDREGHAEVPAGHVEKFDGEETQLGSWVNTRRGEFVGGVLSAGRVAEIEAVPGWVWKAL